VPWGLGFFDLNLLMETAGKRGYRIAEAEKLAEAVQLQLGEGAWKVRSSVRNALLDYLLAVREQNLRAEEVEALSQTTTLISQRLKAGEGSQPELSFAQSILEQARVRAAQAAARVPETRNTLAVALGVPVEALEGAQLSWWALEHPLEQSSLSSAMIQRLALTNRIDLRTQLARYAAADEALRLEIARQFPDVTLNGGYAWDGGDNIFHLGPSIALPVFNQNQGPIAEAEARRRQLRAEFLAMQKALSVRQEERSNAIEERCVHWTRPAGRWTFNQGGSSRQSAPSRLAKLTHCSCHKTGFRTWPQETAI
jgi:outer membrane protein TolC